MRIALITGITGQDGSYLTELLLSKGYEVHGIVRRSSRFNRSRIDHLTSDENVYGKSLFLHYADLHDTTTLRRIFSKVQPDEFYHLAGQSHVGLSFEIPESTAQEVAMATLSLLEICRDQAKPVRLYHASSSETFGTADESPQTEKTAMRPTSPYGVAKSFATQMCRVYRQSYDLFVCNGIAYNHESIRRGENFVTRKITKAAAEIALGRSSQISLGDIHAKRDWGHAQDYVIAMWKMLQAECPDDYILSTGKLHSIEDILKISFSHFGLDYKNYLKIDPRFVRPSEPVQLVGNPSFAETKLNWKCEKSFSSMILEMCDYDYQSLQKNT